MKIYGLQKMTLLDYPGHVACTVFLGGCDFRCPYCHNYELVDGSVPPVMDETELLSFLDTRKGRLDGVAVTGGEPCLHRELPGFLRRIREKGFAVKLDTNGAHPEILREVLEAQLADYVAMDIKNCREKYALTVGRDAVDLNAVQASLDLLRSGQTDYELRTTVVAELHTREDVEKIGIWIAGTRRYYLQAFTDRDTVPFSGLHAPDPETMQEYAAVMRAFVPQTEIRGMDM
ncbi:MAG: anaerobic ribonucleoside-triphosphate reductase activating protein [Clostridia bacterium]|nr:anaerobic ribonucleoside-triphosphate reductase activating protein [Clostridia bacterium]